MIGTVRHISQMVIQRFTFVERRAFFLNLLTSTAVGLEVNPKSLCNQHLVIIYYCITNPIHAQFLSEQKRLKIIPQHENWILPIFFVRKKTSAFIKSTWRCVFSSKDVLPTKTFSINRPRVFFPDHPKNEGRNLTSKIWWRGWLKSLGKPHLIGKPRVAWRKKASRR